MQKLRKTIRTKRRLLSTLQQRLASQRLFKHIKKNSYFLSAKHIAFYKAIDGEVDLEPIIQESFRLGKLCYLPSIKKNSKQLDFYIYKKNSKLKKKKFGIEESFKKKPLHIKRLDLVFMPLVAFDIEGNRLGMGGGYYDYSFRHLAFKKTKHTHLIGLAHRCQQVHALPTQPWDIKPDKIIAV